MSDVEVRPTPKEEFDGDEGWSRVTDERELRGVEVVRDDQFGDWPWIVTIWVADFIRTDPLERELFHGIETALLGVPDVTKVAHDDRTTWIVAGTPSGEALVRAASAVVDDVVERARGLL